MDIQDLKIDDPVIYNGCIRFIKSINYNNVEFHMPDNYLKCCKCAKYGIVSRLKPFDNNNVSSRVIERLNSACTPVDDNYVCPGTLLNTRP